MKKILHTLFLSAMSFCLSAQPTAPSQYLFILDGSGSMWQKIGDEYKISVAKSVMKDLVTKLPDQARAGLIAYGHSRKDDCNDIETLTPLAPLDRAAFSAKLDAINPQGKTPIAKSIAHALDLLKTASGPVTVILVSDGLETCEGNACDLVKNAKKQGIEITLHVVGFGIQELDLSALECIAQAGGGRYFPADNAEELSDALEQTVEKPILNGGYLSVKVTLEGKPVDATVKAFKKGETRETALGRTYTHAETNPRVLLLPEGAYDVEIAAITLEGKPVQRLSDLLIVENEILHREVDFEKGVFQIHVTRNNELSDAVVRLYKSGTREVVTQTRSYNKATQNPVKFEVLPGLYDVEISSVEIESGPTVRMEKQLLAGGGKVELAHNFKSGELKVGARQGAALVDATVGVYSKASGLSVASGRTYQADTSNPKTFILEPGEYEVRLNAVKPAGLGKKTLPVTVTEKGSISVEGVW